MHGFHLISLRWLGFNCKWLATKCAPNFTAACLPCDCNHLCVQFALCQCASCSLQVLFANCLLSAFYWTARWYTLWVVQHWPIPPLKVHLPVCSTLLSMQRHGGSSNTEELLNVKRCNSSKRDAGNRLIRLASAYRSMSPAFAQKWRCVTLLRRTNLPSGEWQSMALFLQSDRFTQRGFKSYYHLCFVQSFPCCPCVHCSLVDSSEWSRHFRRI